MDPFMSDMAGRAGGSAIAKVGTSIIEKLAGKAADVIKDRLAQVDLWSEYERKYVDRYGKVKLTLSGMREAVPLEQIYTGVRFLDRLSIGQFASIEALEKGFRKKSRRFGRQDCLPQDGITVANQHPLLMVLGGPGAGKSAYLRRVGLEALRGRESQFQHECIPVILELSQFDGDLDKTPVDIKAAIANEFSHVGFDFSAEFVEEALQQGKLLILLDGLDEVPKANRDKVHQAIQDFVCRYDKKHQSNRFIASCRVAAFRRGFIGFIDIELADFDDEQIQNFVNNWFQEPLSETSKTAERCWNLLNESSYRCAKELAQTPLLLVFLCSIYGRTQSFPNNRVVLYQKILDIFLEQWADEKMTHREPVYASLNTELEKILLTQIAYHGFVEDRLFFTRTELIDYVQNFLEDSVDKPKYLDGKAILNAIAIQQGILVERAENIYSFSHLSIQEYLIAQHLSQNGTLLREVVEQRLTELRWKEVFLMVSSLLPKADLLLEQMAAQQKLSTPKLQAFLSWANRVTTDSATPIASLAKQVFAICFVLALGSNRDARYSIPLTFAFSLANELGFKVNLVSVSIFAIARNLDLVLNLAHNCIGVFNTSVNATHFVPELEKFKNQVPDYPYLGLRKDIIDDHLLQVCCEGLALERELINLSGKELHTLTNHFYICELMILCKDSGASVSLDVWKSIENAMVMPIPENES
jgi:NACHT domain